MVGIERSVRRAGADREHSAVDGAPFALCGHVRPCVTIASAAQPRRSAKPRAPLTLAFPVSNVCVFIPNAQRHFPFFFGDRGYTLLNVDGELYCCEANSPGWGYPTVDAVVLRGRGKEGLAIEIPLDGSVYDLATGEVLEWMPNDKGSGMQGMLRKGLNSLKKDETPSPIGVYDVQVLEDGNVAVKRDRRVLSGAE